jgi:hypothetical protein
LYLALTIAGAPHPKLGKGMDDEHCSLSGHDVPFKTDNYEIMTTPAQEFNITVRNAICPPENMLDKAGKRVRFIRSIEELKTEPLVIKAKLKDEEIVSVVCTVQCPAFAE